MATPEHRRLAVHFAGYTLIALAIYFGLRHRPATSEAPPAPAPSPPPPPAIPLPAAAAAPSIPDRIDPPGSAPARDAATREAQAVLDANRAALTEACTKEGLPPQTITVRVLFAADGKEERRSARSEDDDVGRCVSEHPTRLSITPPGERLAVMLTLSLP